MKNELRLSRFEMRASAYLFCLSVLLSVCVGFPVQAEQYACSNRQVVSIVAPDDSNNPLICRASIKAIDFLAAYGLYAKRQIIIEIIEESINNHGYNAYGSYDSRIDRMRLMSMASIHRSSVPPMMYDEPFDAAHYEGAVAHEVAHAVVQHNMSVTLLSPAPQEYLAHATQLAVLAEQHRERIIVRADVEAWEPGDAISDIYMALQPTRFAVKSFLHLTTAKNPSAFITILLNAKWFYVYVPD